MPKIILVGCGKMGKPILLSILASKIYKPNSIVVVNRDNNKLLDLKQQYNFTLTSEINLNNQDTIILAVPPQEANIVLQSIKLDSSHLVISVMAGFSVEALKKYQAVTVIRAMPNLALAIQQGLIAYYAPAPVTKDQKELFLGLFKKSSVCLEVDSDNAMDSCTAVLGSGIGFVFYLMNSFYNTSIELGLSKQVAEEIVFNNFIRSAIFAKHSNKSLDELIEEVCTKKGTTEAGMKVLKENNVANIIKKCLISAYKRSKELFYG